MKRYTTQLLFVALLGAGCEISTGSSDDDSQHAIDELPHRVVVTTVSGGVQAKEIWVDIVEFEPSGDALLISGIRLLTLNGEPLQVTVVYGVCEIDVLVVLPMFLAPTLLGCEQIE